MIQKSLNSFFIYCLLLVFALPHVHAQDSGLQLPAGKAPQSLNDFDLQNIDDLSPDEMREMAVLQFEESRVKMKKLDPEEKIELLQDTLAKTLEKSEEAVEKHQAALARIEAREASGKKIRNRDRRNLLSEEDYAKYLDSIQVVTDVNKTLYEEYTETSTGITYPSLIEAMISSGNTDPVDTIFASLQQDAQSAGGLFGIEWKWVGVAILFVAGILFHPLFIILGFVVLFFVAIKSLSGSINSLIRGASRAMGQQ